MHCVPIFTSVVGIGFNPSTVKCFFFAQKLRHATIIERKINIIHMLNLIHSSGRQSDVNNITS